MSDAIQMNAEQRSDSGKGASRRLRKEGLVPAIVYGGEKEPAMISLKHNELIHELENEATYTQIIDLSFGGNTEKVILRDLQRHPFKNKVMHADFYRVNMKQTLNVNIPIHVINDDICVGVKMEGGMLTSLLNEIEVVCLPKDLPEYIEVDAENIHLGETLHLSEIKMPEGVESAALQYGEDHDTGVLSVVKTRATSEEVEEEAEGEAPEAAEEESGETDEE